MSFINHMRREIYCKIVYYGPGLCGKTTNLQHIHDNLNAKLRGDMTSLATQTERTLFFDFLPLSLGEIGGFKARFQLYTVPGQVFYDSVRKLVLRNVDGVVFVADSQMARIDANLESMDNLQTNLAEHGVEIEKLPLVIQYNKRDAPSAMDVEELRSEINRLGVPDIEAVAVDGTGVFDTLKLISKLVWRDLQSRMANGQ